MQPRLRFYRLHRPCPPAWGALLWELARAVAGPQAVAVVEVVPLPPSRAEVVRQARVLDQVLKPLQALGNPVQGPARHRPRLQVGVEALLAGPGPLGPEVERRARALQRWRLVTQTRRAPRSRTPLLQALPSPGYPQQVEQNRHWLRRAKRLSWRHLRLRGLGHRGVG